MTEAAINSRLGISAADRAGRYAGVRMFNHRWNDPEALVSIGAIDEDEVERISGGLMRERVDVTINKLVLEYDLLLVVGPTFPHEVAGFSGGNKYLFPGISGPAIIDMFHWLGALITNPGIIGVRKTPVRQVIDRAAAMVPVERKCISLVSQGQGLAGLFAGDPEDAWEMAARLSAQIHVVYTDRPYDRVLSCAPPMYDELWVAGKCVYKLEPIVADGGELICTPHTCREFRCPTVTGFRDRLSRPRLLPGPVAALRACAPRRPGALDTRERDRDVRKWRGAASNTRDVGDANRA